MNVRTRFAPSPTGFLHIGAFRTALYAWLLARRHNGEFILRIEDTDNQRKVDGAVQYILESLQWLGLDIDEGPSHEVLKQTGDWFEGAPELGGDKGPYTQSARVASGRYQEIADKLVDMGAAYRCDMTAEELAAERAEQEARGEAPGYAGKSREKNVGKDTVHVVRFKMPAEVQVSINDAVRGTISWDNPPLNDPVLLKSDGVPTYHLASVVDDHDMEITHVIRGDEWLGTAPLHALLYDALEWERPLFCHMPLILGSDGKKLSKRHGAEGIDAFRKAGYLPDALINALTLIGWSPGEGSEQEIFSRDELIKLFSLDRVGASSGVYDPQRLEWINGVHIRNLSAEEFTRVTGPYFQEAGIERVERSWSVICPHVQERTKLLPEAPELCRYIFEAETEVDMQALLKKKMTAELAISILEKASEVLDAAEFVASELETALKQMVSDLELKMGQVFVTLRVAITGGMTPLPLFESIEASGKAKVQGQIERTLAALKEQ